VNLRGIVRSGLEYCAPDGPGSLSAAGVSEAEIAEIVQGWQANVIRVPFNQAWARKRPGYDAEPYLSALDFVIGGAAANGAYTLLDLHWLDAVTPRGRTADGRENFVAPLPDAGSIDVWRQLASRYRNEPAVLYDLFNEPHDPLPDDGLVTVRRVTMAEWKPWAAKMAAGIRSQNPDALIFISGIDWGYDLRGFPIAGLDDVVYSTHVYPNKGCEWDRTFGKLARKYPVFAAEWGGGEADLEWGRRLADYFAETGIGWTAWSWADHPRLVEWPPAPPYRPTRFGELVKGLLRAT
jgi:hypothetical protein